MVITLLSRHVEQDPGRLSCVDTATWKDHPENPQGCQQQQGSSMQSEWEQPKNCTQYEVLPEVVSANAKPQCWTLFFMAVQHRRDVVLQHRAPLPTWGRAAKDQEPDKFSDCHSG